MSARAPSDRRFADDRRSTNEAVRGEVVGERAVLRPAIVPHRRGSSTPSPANLKLRRAHVLEKKTQQRLAFARRNALDMRGKVLVDEECLSPGRRVGPHDGMRNGRMARVHLVATV